MLTFSLVILARLLASSLLPALMQADMMITLTLYNMTSEVQTPAAVPKTIAHFTMLTAMPEVEFSKLETTLITEDIRV